MSDILGELIEEYGRLSCRSIDHGCVDSGIAANVADRAADEITALRSRITSLEAERDAARDEGVKAERERCALVAETEVARLVAFEESLGFKPETASLALHAYQCEKIAAKIRSGE